VRTLAKIALEQAGSGGRAAALKSLAEAARRVSAIDKEMVWNPLSSTPRPELPDKVSSYRFRDILEYPIDSSFKLPALRALAVAQSKAGDIAAAYATVATFPEERLAGDRARVLKEIGEVQIAAADFAGALETAARIEDREHFVDLQKKELLEMIGKEQARSGDARGVLTWVDKRETAVLKLAALKGMAEGIGLRRKTSQPVSP
jgi:hypothetical protein